MGYRGTRNRRATQENEEDEMSEQRGSGWFGRIMGLVTALGVIMILSTCIWWCGAENVQTPAGYAGYIVQKAIFGKTVFEEVQYGPTSTGRSWMLRGMNVSLTPYTYDEDFSGKDEIPTKDNMSLGVTVHVIWKIQRDEASIRAFFEKYSTLDPDSHESPDKIVHTAYDNLLKAPIRTATRNAIQEVKEGWMVKDQLVDIGLAIGKVAKQAAEGSPYEVLSVQVGRITYPGKILEAINANMAADQENSRQTKLASARITEANGIASAMNIVQSKLTPLYLQHEAIEAQKMMVGSPNHTVMYIPVGNMGVPLVGNLSMSPRPEPASTPVKAPAEAPAK